MRGSLHLFFTRTLPFLDEDHEILFVDAAAGDPVEYATTLVTTCEDLERLPEVVSRWWHEQTGADACIELVTDQATEMARHERERLQQLAPRGWSLHSCFVAYPKDSSIARAGAVQLLMKTSIARH
jgi:hypothetical protein